LNIAIIAASSSKAKFGEIGGKGGISARIDGHGELTDPQQAAEFVERTQVDSLVVAVGSSHSMKVRNRTLDQTLINKIASLVDTPLVLHGGSGVTDEETQRAVRNGITKVNVATYFSVIFTNNLHEFFARDPESTEIRQYMEFGRKKIAKQVAHLLLNVFDPTRHLL
jgi:fructose/tagatose bisphosphate aldolase